MGKMGDPDPTETAEWLDALGAVQQHRGGERSNYLINKLVDQGRRDGVYVPRSLNTAYCNTIPPEREDKSPVTGSSNIGCAPSSDGTRWPSS